MAGHHLSAGWPVIHDPKKVTPGTRKGKEPTDPDYVS
jgi:hypothetical protein